MTTRAAHGVPLPAYALFGGLLASAGLPIYINAPKVYVDQYGVSLGALGLVLFAIRLIDVVQDPFLGWVAGRLSRWRGVMVSGAVLVLGAAMIALFAVTPPVAPLLWFALTLIALFSAYSFLTICFYAQGVTRAQSLGPGGHLRLAGWRESGALLGVSLAAVAPALLMQATARPFAAFALLFAAVALAAGIAMRGEWRGVRIETPSGLRAVLGDRVARRLLLLAMINAAPVAVSSTLFLFYVESRLAAPGWEGPLLLLFFLAAAGSAPLWGRVARRFGAKRALLAGMVLSIAAFGWAATLGPGDLLPFALVCLGSGAALGADMTLLPAIFATRMARIAPEAGLAFGLWAFVTKFTLALAAVTLLPVLQASGFHAGAGNPAFALTLLGLLYAALPCALKLLAIALLATTDLPET